MTWTTIIADASFCPNTLVGGYGFWIANSARKLGGEGVLKDPVNNISAEMMALLNAVHVALSNQIVKNGDAVLLQTDCQAAIDAFHDKRTNITDQEIDLVQALDGYRKEHNIHFRFKHVKGHTNYPGSRFKSNNACDRRAKRQMRKARDCYTEE